MIAYAANDVASQRGRTPSLSVTDVNWTLKAEGNLLNVAATPAVGEDDILLLEQTSKPSMYVRVLRVPTGTSIYILPIQSEADGAGGIGTVYTNTATLSAGGGKAVWETQASCTIDLSEAPGSLYRFLILAAADLSTSADNKEARALLRIGAKAGDPFSGVASGEAVCTVADASDEWFGLNFVREFSMNGGDRLDMHMQTRMGSGTNAAQLNHGHVLALRTDGWAGYLRGANNGDNASPTTAATSTEVVAETVTPNAGGTWLVFAAALLSHSSGTLADRVPEVKIKNGATVVHSARKPCRTTTDRLAIGVATFVTGINGTPITMTINNQGATGNAEIRNTILVAIPIASLPAWLAQVLTNAQNAATVTGDPDFQPAITSAAQTLTAGTHIELVTTGAGIATGTPATDWYELRPVWGGDYPPDQLAGTEPLIYEDNATPRGHLGHGLVSATSQPNSLNFFLKRGVRVSGASSNIIEASIAPDGGDAHNIAMAGTRFVWIREAEQPDPGPDEPVTLAVDMQTARAFKNWDPTGTTGLYQKSMPDVVDIDRGILNGADLPQGVVQASAPKLTTPGTWGWDPDNKIAYGYMPAVPAGRTPNDDRETLVLVPVEWVSRNDVHLIDDQGDTRPYRPRLTVEPRIRSELQIRSGGTEAGTSIGELEIENASGTFDDRAVRDIWEGLYATIYRGHLRLSRRLSDFQVIARATIAMPEMDTGKINVGLYDRALQLARPVSESRITVYTGLAGAESVRDFVVLPVLVGSPRRVQAQRISTDAASPTEHWFKVCQHSVVGFGSVFAASDDQTPIATGYVPTAADLLCGQFKVKNAAGGGNAAFNSDTLYVDIAGGIGGGIATGGALMEYVAQNFPLRIDEFSGSPATTIASANHTSAIAGANCQVATTTGFSVGDVVRVVSNAAATTYYHAIVTAILAGPARLTLVPTYETGDQVVGTVFTFGAASVVIKTTTSGGLQVSDLVRYSFRKLDRGWRQQFTGGVYIPSAPKMDMVIPSDTTVADVFNKICRSSFAYWYSNPMGRLQVGVADREAADLLLNANFQTDQMTSPVSARSIWPFVLIGGLTAAVTTGVKYEGVQAVEITRTALQQDARLRQQYLTPGGSDYLATALVALRAGDGSAVRLQAVLPSDGLDGVYGELSDPLAAESGRWKRINFPFTVPRGGAGTTEIELFPFFPDVAPPIPSVMGTTFLGSFSPNTSLIGWIDASRVNGFGLALPPSGTKLSPWKDMGSGATDATATGAKRPRWWKNEIFRKPGVRFDNTDDAMSWLTLSAAPYTIYAVYALTNDDVVTQHRALSGGGANWFMGPHPGVGASYLYHAFTGGAGGATSGYVGAGAALAAGQFACCGLVATSSALAEHFVNGASAGTNTATGQVAPGLISLGDAGATANTLYGVIAEALVWNRVLSTAERTAVEAYLMAKYGIKAVTLAVADFQVFKLGAIVDDQGGTIGKLVYDQDIFYEAEVPFNVNSSSPEQASFIRIRDDEARQLTSAVSQAKNAIPTARRLTITDVMLDDAPSAAGVAAAYAAYFGRPRSRLPYRKENAGSRIVGIGERVMHRASPRTPELIDEHPIHLVVASELNQKGALGVDLTLERQTDFIADRTTIAASDLALGLIFLCADTACPAAGYSEEVVGMRGYYVLAGAAPDLSTIYGNPTHRHQLDHLHPLENHAHTYALLVESVGLLDGSQDIQNYIEFTGPNPFPIIFNVAVARGFLDSGGTHTHDVSGSGFTTGNPSPAVNSSNPTATLRTYYGGNDITWKNVLFCKRVGGTGNFPTTLIAGYDKAVAPTGWNRCDGGGGRPNLDGFAIRAARPTVDGTDTTTKAGTTFSPSNAAAGSALALTVATNVYFGTRIAIVNGANTVHVVVVTAPGTGGLAADTCMAQTTHEDNDTADVADGGTTYPAGSAVQIADARPAVSAGDTTTDVTTAANKIAVHRHQKSGGVGTGAIAAHAHTAAHKHFGTATQTIAASVGSLLVTVYNLDGSGIRGNGYPELSLHGHQHDVNVVFPIDARASSTAGGDITSTSLNAPDRYGMVFIIPADGLQNVLFAGMTFFSDTVCPGAFSVAEDAIDLLIVGAAAGQPAGAIVGGHGHSFDATAHTLTHVHEDLLIGAAKFKQVTGGDKSPPFYAMAGDAADAGHYAVVAAYYNDPTLGHVHYVTVTSVQSVAATLTASTGQASEVVAGLAACPPAFKLLVCRKD